MNIDEKISELRQFANDELFRDILPFWRNIMRDEENGGFFGGADFCGNPLPDEPKGLILNARLLWTFSSVYRLTRSNIDMRMASEVYKFLTEYFYDKEHGGYFWTVKANGEPDQTKKQVYALGFVIYGLSEFSRATGSKTALEAAIEIFRLIEEKAFDHQWNGYNEAYARDWSETEDFRLSEKDMNEKKTMNTHLHILEAYTNLYRIWKDEGLAGKVRNLVRIFMDRIYSPSDHHLGLFFDEQWVLKSNKISYGHDIEAGWLIQEAAEAIGDYSLIREVEAMVPRITYAALEGMGEHGGLFHEAEREGIIVDNEFEWWPQAEALVGLFNAFQLTAEEHFLDASLKTARFISRYFVDSIHGEWHFRLNRDLQPVDKYGKAGLWKCPYHNGRACMEIISRTDN